MRMEEPKIPQAGGDEKLCRARTDEGLELPVIDVTHSAFRVELSEAQLAAEMEKAVSTVRAHSSMPGQEQHAHMQGLLRGSFLAPRIAAAQGGVLGGMSTYFLKLGPDNLGDYAGPIDRAIAGSMPSLSCRIRLQHMAQLIADMLEPALETSPGRAVRLVNIAGGPGMDTINALIVLRKRRPELLRGRSILVQILDIDESGPRFGRRSLSALGEAGAPLEGLSLDLQHVPFDWSQPATLDRLLPESAAESAEIVGTSSEGGLFDYGSDEEVVAVLAALHRRTPAETFFVGSISRGDGSARILNEAGRAAIRLRSPEGLSSIAHAAGWKAGRVERSPLSMEAVLLKSAIPA